MASNEKDAEPESNSKDNEPQSAGFKSYARVFGYADKTARTLYATSVVAAMGAGVTLPLTNIVFGQFVTAFTNYAVDQPSREEYMSQVRTLA